MPNRLFENVEMKVEITNMCRHGRCKFCSPLFRPAVKESETKKFLIQFEEHVENYLRGGGKKIILTGGGEPIDAPTKLFGALRVITEKIKCLGVELELLTVYSNGVSLLDQSPYEIGFTNLECLANHGVRDINLSVHGFSRQQREAISGRKMADIDFETLIPKIVGKGIRVMTRTTLARGFIDSLKEVQRFTSWMSSLGVKIVYFSDLFEVPTRNQDTTPGSQDVLKWTDENRINFRGIIEEVKKDAHFELVSEYTRHNDQGMTFEFRHVSGTRVMFGSLVIGNESEEAPTYAYIKPDGSMYWHNNANEVRNLVSITEMQKYRPGRRELQH